MLINYNNSYQAAYVNVANGLTGSIQSRYNSVEYYFQLKKENAQLIDENAKLKQALFALGKTDDTSSAKLYNKIDSLFTDSLRRGLRYVYFTAKVVNNSLTNENNYITLKKGAADGIKVDMAVDGPQGIVGRVIAVSQHYSIVMSLLNHNSKISTMLKNNNYTGIVDWDGRNPSLLTLHNIPQSISNKIKIGDTAITSNLSGNFPPGLMVGRVAKVTTDPASNFLAITLKSATNFYTLQYVYLIHNTMLTEQRELEANTQKQMQPTTK